MSIVNAIPIYPHRAIATLDTLAITLGVPKNKILNVAKRAERLYREVPQRKKDGSLRMTYDANIPLKAIQDRIVKKLLRKILFPTFIHGGIRDRVNPRDPFSNAQTHSKARVLILEDIRDFYPSVKASAVFNIWHRIFRFPPPVAEVLTQLTTYRGAVPQGAKTSGYLANLVFGDAEGRLVQKLDSLGLNYGRFVDDIGVSSRVDISTDVKTEAIGSICGMLAQKGFRPKRSKHQILKAGQQLAITGLVVNGDRPAIPKAERKRIRAGVHSLHCSVVVERMKNELAIRQYYNLMGRVGRLKRCGHRDAHQLMMKLKEINHAFDAIPFCSVTDSIPHIPLEIEKSNGLPW